MFLDKFIGRQVGHPRGIMSGLVAATMNRTNAYMNTTTVQLLGINQTDRVLDIGFGGGVGMVEMTKLAKDGLVAGIDVSDAMLERGGKKFSKLISEGKVDIREGSASQIPYKDGFFDKISAVNSIYFWPDPIAGLREVHRVLKNGGVFILAVAPEKWLKKLPITRHGFAIYSDGQLQGFLKEAGFTDIRIEHREHKPVGATFAIASKA